MRLVCSAKPASQIIFLRNPIHVAIAERDVLAGNAVIVPGIGIIIVQPRRVIVPRIIGVVKNPNLRWAGGLAEEVVLRIGRVVQLISVTGNGRVRFTNVRLAAIEKAADFVTCTAARAEPSARRALLEVFDDEIISVQPFGVSNFGIISSSKPSNNARPADGSARAAAQVTKSAAF